MKVCLITLTWNKYEDATKSFIETLYKYTDSEKFDLIVVDNGSEDGTAEKLKEFAKDKNNFTLICNPKNVGYSKGNNIGLRSVSGKNYDYIGLLNNDILFTPNWLEDTLSIFEEDKQLGMVSPRIQKNGKMTEKNYLDKYKSYLKKYKKNFEYSIEPFFCCVLIKKEVIDKIGLMDENFTPAFWEDNDYCFRAMYAGYSLARSNISFVFHKHSTTSNVLHNEIFKQNEVLFFEKHPIGKWIWEHKKTNMINDFIKYLK